MQNIIELEKKTIYGSDYYYPINDQAKKLCELLGGQKTVTEKNIKKAKEMGFTINQVILVNHQYRAVGEL